MLIKKLEVIMENKTIKHPCRSCVYYNVCGENTRTQPCNGRKTKSEQKKEKLSNGGIKNESI